MIRSNLLLILEHDTELFHIPQAYFLMAKCCIAFMPQGFIIYVLYFIYLFSQIIFFLKNIFQKKNKKNDRLWNGITILTYGTYLLY